VKENGSSKEDDLDTYKQSKGLQYYNKERLKHQNKKIIETAWLLFQEINLI
jgi:hypothetical protein